MWKCSLSYQPFADIMFIKTYLRHQLEKNLLLNGSLTTPWTNKKGMVSCISRTRDFWPKTLAKRCGLYTSLYGNYGNYITFIFGKCLNKNMALLKYVISEGAP